MLCGLYNSNYGRRQTFALLKDEKDYETKYDNNLKWICGLHFMLHNHCMQELNQSVWKMFHIPQSSSDQFVTPV